MDNFAVGATVYKKINAKTLAQVPATIAGSPTVAVYKDDSVTEITAGASIVVDFDGRTGLVHITVDTTADAAYTSGGTFSVVLTAGTADSVSLVGQVLYEFTLTKQVAEVSDKTGFSLSSAGVQAIWDAITSAMTAVGSIGKKLADWTIGTAQTGDSYAIVNNDTYGNAALKTIVDLIQAKTTNLPTDPADASDIAASFSAISSTLTTLTTLARLAASGATGTVTVVDNGNGTYTLTFKDTDGTTTVAVTTWTKATGARTRNS